MYADAVDGTDITSSSIADVSKMIEMLKISIDEIEKTYKELLKTYEESIREELLNPQN
jgi:archaellum component FlaC